MKTRNHTVVWLDHLQARIFSIGLSGSDETVLQSHLPTPHIHHKANSIGSGHVSEDKDFFSRILETIGESSQILIMGPSNEKIAFHNYLREHDPKFSARTITVETADHPTDAEIIAHARRRFGLSEVRHTTAS